MRGLFVHLDAIRTPEDFDLLARWSAAPGSTFASGGPSFISGDELRERLASYPNTIMMIRSNEDERAVGSVSYQDLAYHGSYTIGVHIADPEHWGGGYGIEAMKLLLTYLFHVRNAHRVQLTAAAYNANVLMVFTSGLATVEGRLRDYHFMDGRYHDAIVGSILRHEFYEIIDNWGTGESPDMLSAETKDAAEAAIRQLFPEDIL
ncbi:GNAT family N-acetyltransferase [Microbacterium sp. SLBN-146]|uniref:GNAT family N-acetyltransferase n=1 Tax=Microbacterium sp. SLBN-146 TaxID=2768457 RepID=UPI001173AE28|nr:GNAT family protein [Microbacterium sp. SLBN-146]TQJ31121.1 RimJ/RimL family protein N-acetyltransferase [Microbacterium sp. SLBN-146]